MNLAKGYIHSCDTLTPDHRIDNSFQLFTMPKTLKASQKPVERTEEYLAPDELELVLEALTWFRRDPSGRAHAGRLTWTREKFVRAKLQGHIIVPLARD